MVYIRPHLNILVNYIPLVQVPYYRHNLNILESVLYRGNGTKYECSYSRDINQLNVAGKVYEGVM